MGHGRRKIPRRCRWGLHAWDCHDSRSCRGDHQCLACGHKPENGDLPASEPVDGPLPAQA